MSRDGDDRLGQPRTGGTIMHLPWAGAENRSDEGAGSSRLVVMEPRPAATRPRTERDRAANRRLERAEEVRSAWRLARPTAPEQQMMSVLATLGERYGTDYMREHKIMAGSWYVTHVDYAFPALGRAIEVYGGPHYKPALDRTGTRQEDDSRRIAEITAAGWGVLVVEDTALTQARWAGTVEAVRAFLERGNVPAQRRGR